MATIVFDLGLSIAHTARGAVEHSSNFFAESHLGGKVLSIEVSSIRSTQSCLTGADLSRLGNGRGGCASTKSVEVVQETV
jgi:hypothetical protein